MLTVCIDSGSRNQASFLLLQASIFRSLGCPTRLWPSYFSRTGFDMKALGCDQPCAIDAVPGQIVYEQHRIYSNPHFREGLRRGAEVDQKNFIGTFRAE